MIAACSKAPSVPAPLESVGHHGEDLYDAARAKDWAAAAAQLDTLKQAAADLPVTGERSGQLNASVKSQLVVLATSVANLDRAAAMRGANEVTRLAAELTRAYNPPVPVEITLLDYSGRELELWAEAGDLAKLRDATATMRRTWNTVRPAVEKRPAGPVAAVSFDGLVARAESATTVGNYYAVATPILDEVDNLEQLFP